MNSSDEKHNIPIQVFYSYVPTDEDLYKKLEIHLSILQRQGLLISWHAHKILLGTNKRMISDKYFASAQLILLLISPEYLASNVAYNEMQAALQRQQEGLAHVLPILLKPVVLEEIPFAHLQMLPRNGKPVTLWNNRDLAFVEITRGIHTALEHIASQENTKEDRSPTLLASSLTFLSHAPADQTWAKRLREDLAVQDIIGWLGPSDLVETENMERREAIQQTLAVVLLASPSTRFSRLVKQELKLAEMYQRPIFLFWVGGNTLAEVTPAGYNNLTVFDAREHRYQQALQDLLRDLRQPMFSTREAPFSTKSSLPVPRNPYKGLQAFGLLDSTDFFGRDQMIATILTSIEQLLVPDQSEVEPIRMLTIMGPSGSGKSSVVMAGVLPQIKQGALPGSEEWILLDPLLPGKRPIEALIRTLAPLFPERSLKSLREDLEDDSVRGLHLLLATQVKQSKIKVVLVIDQFEELFIQTTAKEERQQFIDLLLLATMEPGGPLLVLLTLRADFYDRPLSYPDLGPLIKQQHCLVSPMQMQELRMVIEQPARLPDVNISFADELVGDLLFEIQGQIHALPLLEFTLAQLFEKREGRLLTTWAYQQIGGVKGALAQHAARTYENLPMMPDQRLRLTRALFLRLINVDIVELNVTRRRVPVSELIVSKQEETDLLAVVRAAFIHARLLTASAMGETPTLEISHEALIDGWPLLQEWLQGARKTMLLQQTISRDVTEWFRYGRPADRLYQGEQLKEALAWRKENLSSLDEDVFLQACIDTHQQTHMRMIRRNVILSLISLVGGISISSAAILLKTATTGSSTGASNPTPTPSPTPSVGQTLLVHSGHSLPINSIAWSPDGKYIASASDDETVKIWDATTAGDAITTYTGHTGLVLAVAWSPDGEYIASASYDKTVQVWNAITGSNPGYNPLLYVGHKGAVNGVTWSPDGKHIASASDDKTVQIWDATTGQTVLTYNHHKSPVQAVAWAPDGTRIASGADIVEIWDAKKGGSPLATGIDYSGFPVSISWSPDSKNVVAAHYGGINNTNERIWDSSSGANPVSFNDHLQQVNVVAWSPDGQSIASGSDDDEVMIWFSTGGIMSFLYVEHTGSVKALAWSPNSQRIASGGNDLIIRLWQAN